VTNNLENLILERLRRIDDRLSNIEGDVRDTKLRLTAVEEHLLSIQTSVFGLTQRMDRFDERLSRVETRLDLRDAS
jgi:predicted  nucleic acid-binding Zn-ribbon protein